MAKTLAVLYRPKTFEDVTEQKNVIGILKNQLELNECKNAYLFCGGAGTGKTTCARIFANELNKGAGVPIEIDAASNNGVENVRSIIEQAKFLPLDGQYRIYIIDECHNASSNQFQDFLKVFGCPLKFGFSASPFRNGDYFGYAKLRQFLGSPIVNIKADELLENGVMAKPHIYLVKHCCNETEYLDYQSAYQEEVVKNKRRNLIAKTIYDKYKSGILIVVNIVEHGNILQELIPDSKFISGETPLEEREEAIKAFDEGRLPVLIGSTILQEGISITHMKAMVLLCSGKSNVAVLQKIGRSLRFKEGEKTEVDYYDIIDDAKFLSKHSKMRINLYKNAGFTDMKIVDEELNEIKK